MKRILFVDDEARVLEGLENLLYPCMDEWETEFVDSGPAALDRLAEENFNIIVTDMRMPKMDGGELLQLVKERHPEVARIVLSGHSELDATLRAMALAHQFLSKPCDAEQLINVIKRTFDLQDLINERAVRSLIGTVVSLPARPEVFSELTELLSNPDVSLRKVVAVVEKDIGISTNILQVVNTAFFSRGGFIGSIQQAVMRLGATFLKNVVLATEVFREFSDERVKGFSLEALHEHSFLTGAIASRMLEDAGQSEDALLAGTLHDVGKLILATALPERFAETKRRSEETAEPEFRAEYALSKIGHAEVGAYLLGLWGLPFSVVDAVANHHLPCRSMTTTFDVLGAVHVANCLTNELKSGEPDPSLDLDHLRRVGVIDELKGWRRLAAKVSNGGV